MADDEEADEEVDQHDHAQPVVEVAARDDRQQHSPRDVVVVVQDVEQTARQVHAHQHRQHRAVHYDSQPARSRTPVHHQHAQEPRQPPPARQHAALPHGPPRLTRRRRATLTLTLVGLVGLVGLLDHSRGSVLQQQWGVLLLLLLGVQVCRVDGGREKVVLRVRPARRAHGYEALADHGVDLAERHDVGVHELLNAGVLFAFILRPVH